MVKVIPTTKPKPFYENLPHRKSYVNINRETGAVTDSNSEMLSQQEKYLAQFFPTASQQQTIKPMNINVNGAYERVVNLMGGGKQPNYPEGIYPNTFSFWNNLSYVKLVYDDGFVEYCFVEERKCLNLATNHWEYKLRVDVWETYWIKVYQQRKNNKEIPNDIVRWHEDRWDKVTYNNTQLWAFRFLNTQDTAFWNKEKYEQTIKSKITIESGIALTPWTETNLSIIPAQPQLAKLYGRVNISGTATNFRLFGERGFTYAVVTPKGSESEMITIILQEWYGLQTSFYVFPIFNDDILYTGQGGKVLMQQGAKEFYRDYLNVNDGNLAADTFNANRLRSYLSEGINTYLASINFTPKPIILKHVETTDNIAYPIRNYKPTLKNDYWQRSITIDSDKPNTTGLGLSDNRPQEIKNTPTIDNDDSFLNILCDERIPTDWFAEKLLLPLNFEGLNVVQPINLDYEPKIYDEELTNIEYNHAFQDSLIISPKWYFYNNIKELWNDKSVYLKGYQFLQPHITYLLQYAVSGLYAEYNAKSINIALNTMYAPQLQVIQNQLQQFIVNNQSQMNASLNNAKRSAITNAVIGGVAGAATSSNPAGAAVGGAVGFVKSQIDVVNLKMSQEALIEDLGRSATTLNDHSTESSFKMGPSVEGIYKFNTISDIDKRKVWSYHAQNGYYINKLMVVDELATRIYYNHWQINNFKLWLKGLDIYLEYQEYFERLFENGITLWHVGVDVGDYTNENWEATIVSELS